MNTFNFDTTNGVSPVNFQDFVWLGDYANGQSICEYNPVTKERVDFYKINKSNLMRFGIIGQKMKLYFDTDIGMFHLNGLQVMISYKTKEREYSLTGYGNGRYTDIITYKEAYTDANAMNPNGKYSSRIHQYNFGFKKKLSFGDGVEFAFQPILSLPYNKPAFIQIKLVSNTDLDGQLHIKRLGGITEPIEAPLRNGYAGMTEWIVR